MGKIRRIIKRMILAIVLVISILLLAINIPFNFYRHIESDIDYSDWMLETLSSEKRIIDIGMLGAHDAFTHQIRYGSELDLSTAAAIQTGVPGALIRGFSVKQSKTQVSNVTTLLEKGVRYFDIRLTYNTTHDQWMTAHTYFSTPFDDILEDIQTFLEDHPGEFLILDIQHVNGILYDSNDDFTEIKALFEDSGVLSFAYEEGIKSLDQITYGDITNNLSQAGVIILSKFEETDPAFWSYGDSVRSAWANTDSEEALYTFLTEEAMTIALGAAKTGNQLSGYEGINALNGFRVMQGVLTMQMNGEGIIEALTSWSLLSKARQFNPSLIAHEDFLSWMISMPIVMVDYSDSNYKEFNDALMEIIIDYNENTNI